jgi:hypothetical protein
MVIRRMSLQTVGILTFVLAALSWCLVAVEISLTRKVDLMSMGSAVALTVCALAVPFLRDPAALRQGLVERLLCHECGGHVYSLSPRLKAFCLRCGAFPKLRPIASAAPSPA